MFVNDNRGRRLYILCMSPGSKGFIHRFLHSEAAGGIILFAAAVLGMAMANSPLSGAYHYLLNDVDFGFGGLSKPALLWINDGLMAVFFFLIGLEIKREFAEGALSTRKKAILPVLAAIGGMAVPAAIFWYVSRDTPEYLPGWAIPSVTDIAFALGVLALLGSRAPLSLKVLLTAIAVIDDLGAIVIIALFYSHGFSIAPLLAALALLAVLFTLNRKGICRPAPYLLLAPLLWLAVLESGIHATLAGVAVALFIPVRRPGNPYVSPIARLERGLHPWVVFGILPVFAFANSGVPFHNIGLEMLGNPATLGIILGLFIGKQAGVFLALWGAIASGLSPMPDGANRRQLYGVALLCGIGFTMSLFIGGLAYSSQDMQAAVRLGVLAGSVLSGLCGYFVLRWANGNRTAQAAA